MDERDKLVKERKALRTAFTRLSGTIEQELGANVDPLMATVWLTQLEDKYNRLEVVHNKILSLLLDESVTDQEFQIESDNVEEYRDRFVILRCKLDAIVHKDKAPEREVDLESLSSSVSRRAGRRKFKLPVIKFKKFNGDPKDWLGFWGQYRQIHEDEDIVLEDKFQYLIQSMEPGSRAARVVESFPPTAANYPLAVERLQLRFAREEMLVQVYIRQLIRMVMENGSRGRVNKDLAGLYDQLESHIGALASLGRNRDRYADFLFPLVESCLPENVLRAWGRYRSSMNLEEADFGLQLDNLMKFLRKEVEGEERISLVKSGFSSQKPNENTTTTGNSKARKEPTASALVSTEGKRGGNDKLVSCVFCEKSHSSSDCYTAKRMSDEDKKRVLQKSRCCYVCLKGGHSSRDCKANVSCLICDKRHYAIMCSKLKEKREVRKVVPDVQVDSPTSIEKKDFTENSGGKDTKTLAAKTSIGEVVLMTIVCFARYGNRESLVRCILDTGSQRSYLSRAAASRLRLKPVRTEKIVHSLFGGTRTAPRCHPVYQVPLFSLDRDFGCTIEALEQEVICGEISPLTGEEVRALSDIDNIVLAHSDEAPRDIELLLGADILGRLLTGKIRDTHNGLVALHTRLGWSLMGKAAYEESQERVLLVRNLHVKESQLSDLWTLDVIGIQDPIEKASTKTTQNDLLKQFRDTIKITDEGRYQVNLPFKEDHSELPDYRALSWKRHQSMILRLKRDNLYNDYLEVFDEWERNDIIEKVPIEELFMRGCYLPHRPVVKCDSATTKIRPVFDASAKGRGEVSLNESLEKGWNLIEVIPEILDRFRRHPVGVSADIEKAFLQLSVNPEHRDFLRFFHPNGEVFRHKRVVFGVTSSPFLLGAVLGYHLARMRSKYPHAVRLLEHSFYVDNFIASVGTKEELQVIRDDATALMMEGRMNLRCWISNVDSDRSDSVTRILGLIWHLDRDTLACNVSKNKPVKNHAFTKREMLAIINQVFDPIGFVCPVLLAPKLMLQETWVRRLKWDEVIPDSLNTKFTTWVNQLNKLGEVEIPRWLGMTKNVQLHVFADASKDAYAACVFVRGVEDDEIKVTLLRAKSRVAPRFATIPRLELMACLIAVRLYKSTVEALALTSHVAQFWTDSTSVLWWIREDNNREVFVRNRVREIRSLSDPKCWHHIPGQFNPADMPSRGCDVAQLIATRWWEGPSWLKSIESEWPADASQTWEEDPEEVVLTSAGAPVSHPFDRLRKWSNIRKIIRIIAWIIRYLTKKIPGFRKNEERVVGNALHCLEIERAERILWRYVQRRAFGDSGMNYPLMVTEDDEGVMRAKLSISLREDTRDFICPIVLPGKDELVSRLVETVHRENSHVGFNILWSLLRKKFWLLGARRILKRIIKSCVICQRLSKECGQAPPIVLPIERVRTGAIFETTGVDLAGPLLLKEGRKIWIVLYTCAVYRAVHLDLVAALSAEAFMLSFRRFIARRGRPTTVFSDNGTNFRRTAENLSKANWNQIAEEVALQKIEWKFNPPSAPWWGGWWERLIRLVKDLLKRKLGRAALVYEELSTILCEVEALVNSRPLTYIDSENHLIPLTPACFLQEIQQVDVADFNQVDRATLQQRFKYRTRLVEELRQRFRDEYLGQLKIRQYKDGKHIPPRVGDIVLVSDHNKKRLLWPLARVVEIYPGRDGNIRCVKLSTTKGTLMRPIQRLVPLEIPNDSPIAVPVERPGMGGTSEVTSREVKTRKRKETDPAEPKTGFFTRKGRWVKIPQRLDLLDQVIYRFETSL